MEGVLEEEEEDGDYENLMDQSKSKMKKAK
jgi:hypothetical protein